MFRAMNLTISIDSTLDKYHDTLHPHPLPREQALLPAIQLHPRTSQPPRTPPLRARPAQSEPGNRDNHLNEDSAQTQRRLQQARQSVPFAGQARVRRSSFKDTQPPQMLLRRVCCRAQKPRNRLSATEPPGFAEGAAGSGGSAERKEAQRQIQGDDFVSITFIQAPLSIRD